MYLYRQGIRIFVYVFMFIGLNNTKKPPWGGDLCGHCSHFCSVLDVLFRDIRTKVTSLSASFTFSQKVVGSEEIKQIFVTGNHESGSQQLCSHPGSETDIKTSIIGFPVERFYNLSRFVLI